uniref:Evasin n=1 Tax=Amblyomma tuberculatum TaxID=48802 RepID=A0A6M2E5F6_9ACAR
MTMHSAMLQMSFLMLIAVAALQDASRESDDTGTSHESNETDDYYPTGGCTCPVIVLNNPNNSTVKPPGCIYPCGAVNCTLTDEEPCYNISLQAYKLMEINMTQSCPLGTCQNGTCVPNGQEEQCYSS